MKRFSSVLAASTLLFSMSFADTATASSKPLESYPNYVFKSWNGEIQVGHGVTVSHVADIRLGSGQGRQILVGTLKNSQFNSGTTKVLCRAGYVRKGRVYKYGPWKTAAYVNGRNDSSRVRCVTDARDLKGAEGVRLYSKVVNSYTWYRTGMKGYSKLSANPYE